MEKVSIELDIAQAEMLADGLEALAVQIRTAIDAGLPPMPMEGPEGLPPLPADGAGAMTPTGEALADMARQIENSSLA